MDAYDNFCHIRRGQHYRYFEKGHSILGYQNTAN